MGLIELVASYNKGEERFLRQPSYKNACDIKTSKNKQVLKKQKKHLIVNTRSLIYFHYMLRVFQTKIIIVYKRHVQQWQREKKLDK